MNEQIALEYKSNTLIARLYCQHTLWRSTVKSEARWKYKITMLLKLKLKIEGKIKPLQESIRKIFLYWIVQYIGSQELFISMTLFLDPFWYCRSPHLKVRIPMWWVIELHQPVLNTIERWENIILKRGSCCTDVIAKIKSTSIIKHI